MRFYGRRPGLVRLKPIVFCAIDKRYLKPLAAAILSCALFSACGPEYSSKHNQVPNQSDTNKKDIRNNKEAPVTIELIGLEVFRYQATIRWPTETSNVSIFIDKQFAFKANSPSVTSYVVGLDHNREYLITVYSQKDLDTKPIVVSELVVNTPLDVGLTSEYLKSLPFLENKISIQAHRVFIVDSVVTEGKNILVNTDELIADEAELTTFQDQQKAIMDNGGRNGGLIVIKSKKAQGKLTFILRGENGGDGSSGASHSDRALRGPNGKDGYLVTCDADERRCKTTCSPWPENGHQGLPGKVGNHGGNGRYGGNTGSLQLEIAESSPNFHFKIEKVIGTAGSPGSGGPGQQGGPGGFPGKFSEYCSASIGPDGPTGPKGVDGIRETNGVVEHDCVSIGEGFGRCS